MQQQQHGRTLNKRKVVTLLACLLIGWLIWNVLSALFYMEKANREATKTFDELSRVTGQTLAAQKGMEYHATKGYVEKVAREDMLMSKKNETVILFPVDHTGGTSSQPAEKAVLPQSLERFIEWVKGWF